MLANYDRILEEIRREAELVIEPGEASEDLVYLAMHLVDLVDQHRLKPRNIRKDMETLLLEYANRS